MRYFALLLVALCAVAGAVAIPPVGAPAGRPSGPVTHQKKLIDSPLDDISWADSRTVFVLSEQGVLYRSQDGGASWANQTPKLHSSSSAPAVRSLHISPADPHTVFLMGHGAENWISEDMGKTYHPGQELDLHEVKLHPHQPLWLLGGAMSSGCHAEPKSGCHKKMYHSKDGGKTWHESLRYAVQFDWAQPLKKRDRVTPRFPAKKVKAPEPLDWHNLVFATVHSVKHGNQMFGSWDAAIHMFESYDYFKTEHELVRHGNRFLFGNHGFLFVAAVNPHQENEVSLRVSREKDHPHHGKKGDFLRHHRFRTAILPVELTEHSYTILDTAQGSVFLHVNHQPFHLNAPVGHVYISDWSGTHYSLSLPYNHRSGDGKCDFEAVASVEGVYLANFIDEADDEPTEVWAEDQMDDAMAGVGGAGSHHRSRAKTVITFDKGGIWSYLEPPSHDSHGKKITCATRDCHLHLHGITDLYGPFYSSKTATGMIMATGTVGSYLQENIDRINTYLSRDAGLTWYEVARGSHIYEFGDHGGLIVMAYDEGETDSVQYSWDQGETWTPLKISDVPLQIENIIVEPEATSLQFVVYGWQEDSGVLIFLDFAELHQRVCQGHDAPDSAASDYEVWSPSDGRLGGKCLMGHRVSYTRRKRSSQCFNPEQHERAVGYEHCPCTAEDYECDEGYYRKLEGGPCIRDMDVEAPKQPPDVCHNVYHVTKGYRRVPGDTCEGGAEWDRVPYPCPGWIGGSWFGKLVMVILVLVLVALAVSSFSGRSEFVEDCLDSLRRKFQREDYWEIGKKMPHSMADDDFGLQDEEYGQSAHLIGNRGAAGSGSEHDDDDGFKPLPERKGGRKQAVPKLSGPPAGEEMSSLADEFDD